MNSLFLDWRESLAQPWANIVLAMVAILCGSIVGAERERKEKPAGLRTLTLVTLGSAVFTMLSIAMTRDKGDPGRIASQIVTGIGFLGGGAIVRNTGVVTGMTTAATIWIMAAMGMVVGAGYALAGLGLSLLVLGVLTIISSWEKRYLGACQPATVVVSFDPAGGKTMVKIEEILADFHVSYAPPDFTNTPEALKQLRLTYCHKHRHHREFLVHLAGFPEVKEIHPEDRLKL
jgi:putative Mg2+ transporter-C (MgtC) family protein